MILREKLIALYIASLCGQGSWNIEAGIWMSHNYAYDFQSKFWNGAWTLPRTRCAKWFPLYSENSINPDPFFTPLLSVHSIFNEKTRLLFHFATLFLFLFRIFVPRDFPVFVLGFFSARNSADRSFFPVSEIFALQKIAVNRSGLWGEPASCDNKSHSELSTKTGEREWKFNLAWRKWRVLFSKIWLHFLFGQLLNFSQSANWWANFWFS